jgi:hypothetical protein
MTNMPRYKTLKNPSSEDKSGMCAPTIVAKLEFTLHCEDQTHHQCQFCQLELPKKQVADKEASGSP